MAESKKFSVRTDGGGQNVFVTDVFLLSVPEEVRSKALSINDDGRVVLTTMSGGGGTVDTGSLLANASVNSNTLTFTRGDSTTFDLTVNTGSGATTNTGSLLTTASVSLNTITFTKGDASTFNIVVNTGSDQFTGTVTSVGGTGTVNGITLSGTVTTSGNLTLGGSVSINNSNWSGTDLSVANGGTGASSFTSNALLTGNGTSAIQAESNLTFNGSTLAVTGNVTATSFTGSLLGTATNATTSSTIIITDAPTAPIIFYPTFTSGTSGNQSISIDSSTLTYQPSTDTLTVANLTGTASLATNAVNATNATKVAITDEPTAALNFYPVFSQGTSGNQPLQVDSSTLIYNPSTNTLTVANLAGTASVATNIAVTDAGGDTSTYILLAGSQTGNQGAKTDAGLTYNAAANALTATTFAGNASTADTAATASTINSTQERTANRPFYPTFIDIVGGDNGKIVYYDDSTFSYNPGTDTLTVANLTGNASTATTSTNAVNATNATTASTVTVTNTTTGTGPYYLTFSSGISGAQILRTDSSTLTFNATTNTLTVANLTGTASVATNIAVTDSGADTTTWVLLAGSQTGNQGAKTDAGLTYNAAANALTATTFAGNASTADTAATASTINVARERTQARPYYPTFIDIVGGDNGKTLLYDDQTFSYNPSTDTLTVTSSYALTASYVEGGGGGSTDTGSLLTTASVSLNTITFTKGDTSTFNITVNTGSDTTYTAGSGLSLSSTTFAFDGVTTTLPSRNYKPVVDTPITINKTTDDISPGYLYTMNSSGGAITITLRASTAGYEFDFFVINLNNQIDFVAGAGQTVISENGLKANSTGSAITAKVLDSTTWALVGSLKV